MDSFSRNMGQITEKKWPFWTAFFIYCCAHFLFLIHNGFVYDDWYYHFLGRDGFIHHNLLCGRPWIGWAAIPFFPVDDPVQGSQFYIHRILIFIAFWCSIVLIQKIVKKTKVTTLEESVLLMLILALIPLYQSRIFVAVGPYTFGYFFFILSLFLATKRQKLFFRLASLVLLFLSYGIQSLLVFTVCHYALFIHEAGIRWKQADAFRNLMKVFISNLDFFILPAGTWVLQRTFFSPQGEYADYNVVQWRHALRFDVFFLGPVLTLRDVFQQTWAYVHKVQPGFFSWLPRGIFIALFFVLTWRLLSVPSQGAGSNRKKGLWFILAGLALFFFAWFPYVAVGRGMPQFAYWHTHQLLFIPGISLLLLGLVIFVNDCIHSFKMSALMFSARLLWTGAVAALFFLFLNYWTMRWYEMNIDWYKQLSVIENLKTSSEVKSGNFFVYQDNTAHWDAMSGKSFYEPMGQIKAAFPDEMKFLIHETELIQRAAERGETSFKTYITGAGEYSEAIAEAYRPRRPAYRISIFPGDLNIGGFAGVLKLKWAQMVNPTLFREQIRRMLRIDLSEFDEPWARALLDSKAK